jgi:hypothetical protein
MTRADGGRARRSRSPLLRRSVLVPVLSAVAVLVAGAVALAATLGGPGGTAALTGGSPSQSAAPQSGHLLASASAKSKPTAAAGPSQQAQGGQAGQAGQSGPTGQQGPTDGATSSTQTSSGGQSAGPTVTVTTSTPAKPVPVPVTGSAPQVDPDPAATPTITPFQEIHYSGASTVACSSDGSVKSGPALVPITLEVTNNTSETIVVYWINLNGALVLNADLGPGQIETFHTDEGDYWMISRSTGSCFDIFLLNQAATLTAF